MENKKALLTIGIPTYNRSNYLKECLEHICSQITDDIQIVVRDNKSTNYNFEEFIKPYIVEYGVIPYQNEVNVGGDANIIRLFEFCNTKWLIVLGDDDYLSAGALKYIIKTLKEHPDEIFIKFNSSYNGQIKGLQGFAKAMSNKYEFLSSFFTSEGAHNIEKTKDDLFYHYKYLSLKIAQIVRVMIHLRNIPNDTCFFTNQAILKTHGGDITWNRSELIIPYLTMLDLFYREREIFKDNVFRTIIGTLFRYISISDMPMKEKRYFYKQIYAKYGIFNTLHYSFRSVIRVILFHILGNNLYAKMMGHHNC
ncbi:glycosyltransferase involved in cell wall biosynthesis [Bacteroides heparinolyticus]|uniref:Glycosyltransferase involved in cell wall biosynthesis n=1 Tax=Prevotella heparinolytica TaxID=28113 RepID=A0A4R2LI64_9BACE|nr:glycosyltransferase family 2 protein [Bacteroides heparinolyticus]TCO88923.1 glycosyltransferase involved in cell wall biosynthesis [Bacteroides heparinolyticus]